MTMKYLFVTIEKLAFFMHLLAGALLVSMMLVTMADVLTRFIFKVSDGSLDFTFYGGIEIIGYSLLFMVLFSLPYSVSRGQVIVDLFTERMGSKSKHFLEGFYTIGFGFLGLGMCLGMYEAAHRVAESGETTQDLLIPLTYIYSAGTVATAVLALRGFLVSLEQMFFSRSVS
jgi:TRAP-type C4-dicarboxylate transport system permease small subunit